MKARYLVDKSALARLEDPRVRERLGPIIEAGEAATCSIIDLEVLFSARSLADYEATKERRALAYHWVPVTEAVMTRAVAVQHRLAKIGHHRVPIPDLLIAATAEAADLILLHYDSDFDVIAKITGQPTEWVVERGSV